MSSDALVSSTMKGGICELVLNNPGRKNALSMALLTNLNNELDSIASENVRVVIVTGAGGTFSAGADFADLTGTIADRAMDDAIEQVVLQIRATPVPVIAAIEGPCMGGAVDIALACDFNVASELAFFEVPAARLGLLYRPSAIRRWYTRLSPSTLRRILILGERLKATDAAQAGIVSHLVPEGLALKTAQEFAIRIKEGSRDAIASAKNLLLSLEGGEINLTRWEQIYEETLDSPERNELISQMKNSMDS